MKLISSLKPETGNLGFQPSPSIVWLARGFLDYRIPVFAALRELTGGNLRVVYAADYVPAAVQERARALLGDILVPLRGEWALGPNDRDFMANRNLSFRFQPGLLPLLARLRPGVILSDGFAKWTLAAIIRQAWAGTPFVVTYERTAHTERGAQGWRRAYRRWVARRAGAMACSGSLCAQYVQEELGLRPDRIVQGHMVADVEAFGAGADALTAGARAAQRAAWAARGVVMACVGRLMSAKGCRELLEAWTTVEQRQPDGATLVWVGDGPLRGELERETVRRGLRQVRFAGAIQNSELAACYASADVLVMPTLEDNWSLVVPEAMACGLPIVCSRYNGCHVELVQPGRNGWIVDPLDRQTFAAVLLDVIKQANQLPAMGAASRQLVATHTPAHAARVLLEACRLACRA